MNEIGSDSWADDFQPTAHPDREFLTASLFVVMITTFMGWGGWKLVSLILTCLTCV
jgi:hypothetical protein